MKDLEKYLNDYLDYLEVKNYSDRTITSKMYSITNFNIWLKENSIIKITTRAAEKYRNYLINKKQNSVSTQVHKLSDIKNFLKYLVARNEILTNPFDLMKYPKIRYKLKWKLLQPLEIQQSIKEYNIKGVKEFRNVTIVKVLYSTGIRSNELSHIKINDIDYKNEMIRILKGKGDKERVTPASKDTVETIKEYVLNYRDQLFIGRDPEYLFLTRVGTKIFRTDLNKYVKKVLGNEISPHCLRVACATHMLRNGADIRYIQEQLGHSDIAATVRYILLEKSELKKIHSKSHPAEKDYLR